MAIWTKRCFEISCDGGCGDAWEEGPPHFATVADAIEITRSYGWTIIGEGVNARTLCPDCAKKEDCAVTGHQFTEEWHDGELENIAYRFRYCGHCRTTQYDPPFEQLQVLVKAARIVNGAQQ